MTREPLMRLALTRDRQKSKYGILAFVALVPFVALSMWDNNVVPFVKLRSARLALSGCASRSDRIMDALVALVALVILLSRVTFVGTIVALKQT